MKEKGILTVVSGFAGSGKGTVMNNLLRLHGNYALSISATTREPRPGEVDGREYFFKTKEEFQEMVRNHEFLEHATYVGNEYGTPQSYVDEQLAVGKDVILEIEIQGALAVKEKCPDALLVFITPPDAIELENRLVGRGTESYDVVVSRMKRAVEESEAMPQYDYILVNDDVEECTERLHSIIQAEHSSAARQGDFIRSMQNSLKSHVQK